ncbi:MAG: hypothetical protein ACLP4W_18255 [Mycobacterium sp.]|uniref:hypothetical protein n=1 Tax=Mycobacterium sp. TaxID=1785 RepID=UPI003F96647D
MGVRDTFNNFQPFTRRLLIASFVVGLLLLIGFSLTDMGVNVTLGSWDPKPNWLKQFNAEWFHSHAYIPNILAAITGFFIGVPIALVILATFVGQREDAEALKRVNATSLQAWNRFKDSVFDLCSDERLDGLSVSADLVQRIHNDIYEEYVAYRTRGLRREPYKSGSVVGVRQRGTTTEETDEFQRYLAANVEEFMAQINEVFNRVGSDHSFQVQWAGVRTNWTTVDQYVRLQRFERNLQWFNTDVDAELSHRLSDTVNPLTEFFDVHHVKTRNSLDSMLAARAAVLYDAQLPKEELDTKLLAGPSSGNFFGHQPVTNYYGTALKVRGDLEALRDAVLRVDGEGWPAKFSGPQTGD